MKYISLVTLLLLVSCNEKKDSNYKTDQNIVKTAADNAKETVPVDKEIHYFSTIRPGEKLNKGEKYIDQAEYIGYDNNGDYHLFMIKKGKEYVSLNTDFEGSSKFFRGDILEITWKIDTSYIAGEGEKLVFTEWLIDAKKVKDGNVSLFRKKITKPIQYHWEGKEDYSGDFKDYLYTQVEYYLANTKNDLIKANLNNPDTSWVYSIEDKEKNGRSYTVLGIASEFENRTSVIQWLYIDSENSKLYEYDLPNDKLIAFN